MLTGFLRCYNVEWTNTTTNGMTTVYVDDKPHIDMVMGRELAHSQFLSHYPDNRVIHIDYTGLQPIGNVYVDKVRIECKRDRKQYVIICDEHELNSKRQLLANEGYLITLLTLFATPIGTKNSVELL
jgi:hypothetical protein